MESKIRIMRETPEPKEPVDITKLYVRFSQQYRNVFMVQLDSEMYIYRALGRGEFKQILEDTRFNDYQKEELICSQCLLYPDPDSFTWDDFPAGIPTELKKCILKDSYLDDIKRRSRLHDFYRAEMYNIDNQITCIISEAFPSIDIEEIEQWDVEKTTKYLSRAEWKLQTLHGVQFNQGESIDEYNREDSVPVESRVPQKEKPKKQKDAPRTETLRGGKRALKLTPEKMREREEFLKKFPQFAHDDIIEAGGIEGMAQAGIDVSPALRSGW